jgi:hypothetical protein
VYSPAAHFVPLDSFSYRKKQMPTYSNSTRSFLATSLASSQIANEILDDLETTQLDKGDATGVVNMRIGATATEGLEVVVVDEIVTLTNAVETNLTNTIPAGAVILSVQANLETLVDGDASGDDLLAKVGIGVTADPDKYGITSALTKNLKADKIPDWAVLGSNETVTVKAAKTDGSAATEKFVAGGKVRVRIVYLRTNSLDDAA